MRAQIVVLILVLAVAGCSARREHVWPQPPVAVVVPPADTILVIRATMPPPIAGEPLETAIGEATYYASYFDGRTTASGIPFSNSEYYAAHRTYPFGTLLRVTNLDNQHSVLVHVVDRGPNGSSARARATIIDLSQRAATELDFIQAGRVNVRVEVLHWGS